MASKPVKLSGLGAAASAILIGVGGGCTNGPCRQLRHPELVMPAPTPESAETGEAEGATRNASADGERPEKTSHGTTKDGAKIPSVEADGENGVEDASVAADGRVLVGRPDGSTQCGIAKGRTPEEMEKDLDGIKIYNRSKRPDGRMHIQVCGGPTGRLNIYEIPSGSLKEAERRGFKKFVPGG